MSPIQRFFRYMVPDLVREGRLVVVSGTEVYWRDDDGRLSNVFKSSKFLRVALDNYLPMPDGVDEEGRRRRKATLRAAEDSVVAGDLYESVHPSCKVRAVTRVPSLIFHGERYYPIPKGHHEKLQTYSLCDPINPTPAKGYLECFFSSLGLSTANRARVLGFLTGCLVRPCFWPMPALMLRSPYKNVGKTTIARLAGCLATGSFESHIYTWNGDREFAKRLSSCESVCPFVLLDNVDPGQYPFKSETMAVATQTGQITQRILGASRIMSVRQPTFVVTMNGGAINHDLMDRLLYVSLDEPRPAEVKQDLMEWLRVNFEQLRDELATLVLQTVPDAPTPIGNYRFVDFYRHVAPVVRLFGLDPAAIVVSGVQEAQTEVIHLYHLLAKHCKNGKSVGLTISELLAHLDGEHSFRIPEGSEEGRMASLRGLLAFMPHKLVEQYATMYFTKGQDAVRGTTYCVRTEVRA